MKHEHNRRCTRPVQTEASKSSLPNRSITIKRKNEKKQHVQGKPLNHLKEKKAQTGPSFKLVCTNLDDLRALINKTEDELDDLESTKKRLNRWYNRRGAVKDLHSTLIRLLNELTPWEPKLTKAYQRNRLRLKKEFEVFKNHPEYSNFVREEFISSSDDGDLELLLDQFRQSAHEDPEHILPRGLGGTVNELSAELSTETPVIHISYDQRKKSPSAACNRASDRADTLWKTCKSEPSHQPWHSNSSLTPSNTVPLSKPNLLHVASGKVKNYTPIPTLLAKNVGNKVTLMKQPSYLLETDKLNVESKRTMVSTENIMQLKVNGCSSGPSQNSHQRLKQDSEQSPVQPGMDSVALPLPVLSISKTAESLKESTKVSYIGNKPKNPVNSSSTNLSSEEVRPQQVVILPSNFILNKPNETFLAQQCSRSYPVKQSDDSLKCNSKMDTVLCMSGVLIPENKILVQQVPPSKNIDLTDTCSSFSDIPNFPKSQPSAIKCTQNYSVITSAPSGILMPTDSEQELKTVCIRESQSILVTTRGGNTGIVKVQKSSDHPACLSKSPVIKIAPQFQAYTVPKTTPTLFSDAAGHFNASLAVTPGSVQTQSPIQSLKSNTKVTTCAKTTSISFSRDLSPSLSPTKCQAFTGLSGYMSTSLSKPETPESYPSALVKTNTVSKPCSDKTNEDNRSHSEKLILISASSHDVKTLPTSVALTSSPKVKAPLPVQGSIATLKQATFTRPTPEVMKTLSLQKMDSHTLSSVNPVSLLKDKADFVFSETSPDTSSQVPSLTATTIAQNTAVQPQSSKCREQTTSVTAQPAFTNSSVISGGITVPASSLKGLKHLSISSMSNITSPSTNPSSATSFKKNHCLSTMISGNLNIYPVTSQSISNPLSTPNTQSKHLNSLLISNASGGFDKTSLSSSLAVSKPQVSFSVPKSSEITEGHTDLSAQTTTNTSITATGTVQQQIVISTSMPLPGGAHIVLNNAKFMVPPKGLDPGSHIFFLSGNAPQQLPATSAKEAAAAFQEVHQAPVLQSATRLPCVPSVKSFVACTLAVAPLLQADIVPSNKSHLNKTKTVEKCPFLQSAGIESTTEGASRGLLSTQGQSQHPTISSKSISCSSSTALMHMGHSSLLVRKEDPTPGLKFL